MSDLYLYRDNILSKVDMNNKIDETISFLRVSDKRQVEIRLGRCKDQRIMMDNRILIKLLEEIKKKNDSIVDRYLALSFDKKNYYKSLRKE